MSVAATFVSSSILEREESCLASYAVHTRNCRGRRYPEEEHVYRGPFQRDRDRILHSAAFRRLSGKMQVFTGDMGDYHRTRLTHSCEVSSIARTMGRVLRLNEDLIEALALFHDIGHPPFGHAGEQALNECLAEVGGFCHNKHALVIAEELEDRHQHTPGLNLTWDVLDGQISRVNKSETPTTKSIEAFVVDAADSLAYDAHDVDDALKLGLVSLSELSEVPLANEAIRRARSQFGNDDESVRKSVVHELLDEQVTQALTQFQQALAGFEDIDKDLGDLSVSGDRSQLEEFLFARVYRHDQVRQQRRIAMNQVRELYEHHCRFPGLLPPRFRERCEKVGIPRAIGDYLACMTDRYCSTQHRQLCS